MKPIESRDMNRREAGAWILSVAGGLAITPSLLAQPTRPAGTTQQPQPTATDKKSPLDSFLVRQGKGKDRTLKVNVNVQAYESTNTNGMPIIKPLSFATAAVVFPVLIGSASHEVFTPEVKGELSFDQDLADDSVTLLNDYQSGTRLGRWEMKDKTGRELKLQVDIPMRTWNVTFDEAAANEYPWPKADWGAIAASTLQPQTFIDHTAPEITDLVSRWCEGKDPKKLKPVALAKFLMGRVLEHVQPSGNGQQASKVGLLEGLNMQLASVTANTKVGSEHDMAVMLAAVYRAAGLPCRTVIGWDTRKDSNDKEFLGAKSKGGKLRSWVEFCLYDGEVGKELWVPVDVARQRKSGSRAPKLTQTWKYFGSHDELEQVQPFAFHYHPPTTVVAHGSVAFWGWITTPTVQVATQYLTFQSISTPNTGKERTPSADPAAPDESKPRRGR